MFRLRDILISMIYPSVFFEPCALGGCRVVPTAAVAAVVYLTFHEEQYILHIILGIIEVYRQICRFFRLCRCVKLGVRRPVIRPGLQLVVSWSWRRTCIESLALSMENQGPRWTKYGKKGRSGEFWCFPLSELFFSQTLYV